MKGYRFYKEYDSPADKRKDKPNGNVFATCTDAYTVAAYPKGDVFIDGYGSVFDEPNSPCCFTTIDWDWLRENCKRISEAEARKIHPALFARIEEQDA